MFANPKKVRGPDKGPRKKRDEKPRMCSTSVRLPAYVLAFYKKRHRNYTAVIREALVAYAQDRGMKDPEDTLDTVKS